MSVYPDSTTVPNTSNLNWLAGQTKANMVLVSTILVGVIGLNSLQGTCGITLFESDDGREYPLAFSATSYSISSLTQGDSYNLFIQAVNAEGISTEIPSPPIETVVLGPPC